MHLLQTRLDGGKREVTHNPGRTEFNLNKIIYFKKTNVDTKNKTKRKGLPGAVKY